MLIGTGALDPRKRELPNTAPGTAPNAHTQRIGSSSFLGATTCLVGELASARGPENRGTGSPLRDPHGRRQVIAQHSGNDILMAAAVRMPVNARSVPFSPSLSGASRNQLKLAHREGDERDSARNGASALHALGQSRTLAVSDHSPSCRGPNIASTSDILHPRRQSLPPRTDRRFACATHGRAPGVALCGIAFCS